MKVIRSLVLFALIFFLNRPTFAASGVDKGLNFYLAAGPNFIFPTSVRVGWNRWEVGLLTRAFVGANKTFTSSNSSVYAGFGLGVNVDPFPTSLGFQASVGVNYSFFWDIGLRAEMVANANLNGNTMAHALVGVSYGF